MAPPEKQSNKPQEQASSSLVNAISKDCNASQNGSSQQAKSNFGPSKGSKKNPYVNIVRKIKTGVNQGIAKTKANNVHLYNTMKHGQFRKTHMDTESRNDE